MAYAKKCDRCGKLYEEYNFEKYCPECGQKIDYGEE